MDEVKILVKKYMGKNCLQKMEEILTNIIMVEIGVKNAFLFDHACIQREIMAEFLEKLQSFGVVSDNLIVINIELDIVIVNQLMFNCENINSLLVDVTSNLTKPKILDKEVTQEITHIWTNQTNCFSLDELSKNINVSTLFGLLLGYPTIYWFDTEISNDNCLAMEPLIVCNIFVKLKCANFDGTEDKRKHVICNHVLFKAFTKNEQKIFSFSFPDILSSEVKDVIQDWTGKIVERCEKNCFTVRVEKLNVTLPVVAM